MKLTMLGTGNAAVTECYNTCFVIEDQGAYFMVDGGGGNTVLSHLKQAGIQLNDIHHIFVTHKHIDHLLGIIWLIRMIGQGINKGTYEGDVYLYAHDEVIGLLGEMADKLIQKKETRLIGSRIHFEEVKDGEKREICGHEIQFFDICSTKAKQFGFTMKYGENKKLTCCGDEPYSENEKSYVSGSDWLMHEAFCLFGEADRFKPYEKHHSTVKEACETAEKFGIRNLILYHTEDKNIRHRKELYTREGKAYFTGNLYVPEDLEVIEIL